MGWNDSPRNPNRTMKRTPAPPVPCPRHYTPMRNGICPACERQKLTPSQ